MSKLLWEARSIEHDPGDANSTAQWYIWTVEFDIDEIKDCNYLYVRYGAHGKNDDDWITQEISMDIMYTAKSGDYSDNVLEFYWSYRDEVKDSECIPITGNYV